MSATQDSSSLMLITLVIVAVGVLFWRTVIKLMIIGVIVLVVLGFLELLRSLH
jgi:hypothetical protein